MVRKKEHNLVRGHSYLRNRKTGHTYKVGDYFYQFTELLLTDLKESFPYTNFIGIRLGPRDINSMVRRYTGEDSSKSVRKDKFFSLKTSGYDSYFLMVDNSLSLILTLLLRRRQSPRSSPAFAFQES